MNSNEEKKTRKPKVPSCPLKFDPCYLHAAKLHKEVRQYIREVLVPGTSMLRGAELIESKIWDVCGNTATNPRCFDIESQHFPYTCGQAFPLGLSFNEIAAHWAPLDSDDHVISEKDIVKVDFGIHCNGYLVDSAFSIFWDDELKSVAQASQDATDSAIKEAGVDVPLSHLGAVIEEVISSYEYKGRPLQPVRNLCGHGVDRWKVHCGESLPLHKGSGNNYRMKDGEVWACETFASTGKGLIHDATPVSHYMINPSATSISLASIKGTKQQQTFFNAIRTNFHTLAWNPRWFKYVEALAVPNNMTYLSQLVKDGYIDDYPQCVEKAGSFVSQFEHTFMVTDWGKEIFSKGDDY